MKKFYSRAGDDGYTGLLGEGRVPKYDLRIECVGAIDEATAALGFARSSCRLDNSNKFILEIQKDLYRMMAEVSATPENAEKFRRIDQSRVIWLESIIDEIGNSIELPEGFILPGDFIFWSSIGRFTHDCAKSRANDCQINSPEIITK